MAMVKLSITPIQGFPGNYTMVAAVPASRQIGGSVGD